MASPLATMVKSHNTFTNYLVLFSLLSSKFLTPAQEFPSPIANRGANSLESGLDHQTIECYICQIWTHFVFLPPHAPILVTVFWKPKGLKLSQIRIDLSTWCLYMGQAVGFLWVLAHTNFIQVSLNAHECGFLRLWEKNWEIWMRSSGWQKLKK